MDYYRLLNLDKEPFSNSPDPDFFFLSNQHQACLQQLEIALRLKRGLNVVIGEVGTGKTTLCRQMLQRFAGEKNIDAHLILDPDYSSAFEFLCVVAEMFEGRRIARNTDYRQLKEMIKHHLLEKGARQGRVVVLIIDEGQKTPGYCIEILREFLNYETNECKLLQIVIFAQNEFYAIIKDRENFADRINCFYLLKPLSFKDMRQMIRFRLRKAGRLAESSLFTYPAMWTIFRKTRGYPRKIIHLCHQCTLAMIVKNRRVADRTLVLSCIAAQSPGSKERRLSWPGSLSSIVLIGIIAQIGWLYGIYGERMLQTEVIVTKKINKLMPLAKKPVVILDIEQAGYEKKIGGENEPDKSQSVLLPENLGTVGLKNGEILGRLIKKIYGTYNKKYLDHVLDANSHIRHPDQVIAGQPILFPAIPVPGDISGKWGYFIKFDETDDLEKALRNLESFRFDPNQVCLMPFLNISNRDISNRDMTSSLKFLVIYNQCFQDEFEALSWLKENNQTGVSGGEVIRAAEENIVWFANPFSKK
ncbi:AAA family ATPase [Desulfobacterales bacterium HSG16]|nr:AAA family ATPase [Desulfobacterales bacterium HSG16]